MPEGALHPDDADLLGRFRRQEIGLREWTHETHLRVGWLHVRLYGVAETVDRLRDGIRRLNTANGIVNGPDSGYHETVTRVWVALIQVAAGGDQEDVSSAEFVRRNRELLDVKLPLRFYSRDRIVSEQARATWVEPDLEPLPSSMGLQWSDLVRVAGAERSVPQQRQSLLG